MAQARAVTADVDDKGSAGDGMGITYPHSSYPHGAGARNACMHLVSEPELLSGTPDELRQVLACSDSDMLPDQFLSDIAGTSTASDQGEKRHSMPSVQVPQDESPLATAAAPSGTAAAQVESKKERQARKNREDQKRFRDKRKAATLKVPELREELRKKTEDANKFEGEARREIYMLRAQLQAAHESYNSGFQDGMEAVMAQQRGGVSTAASVPAATPAAPSGDRDAVTGTAGSSSGEVGRPEKRSRR